MAGASCILIHKSPIVINGLRYILQQQNVVIREIILDEPDCKKMLEWESTVVFTDCRYHEVFNKHSKYLSKKKNTIIGIDLNDIQSKTYGFNEIISITDSQLDIAQKLNTYLKDKYSINATDQLSDREKEVLKLVALGCSNKQIADKLFISPHTVITHRKNITSKIGIKSISGLTLYAAINNIIDQSF